MMEGEELVTMDAAMAGADLAYKVAFIRGAMSTIRLYAYWNDGTQWVGASKSPLAAVLKPYEDKLRELGATPEAGVPEEYSPFLRPLFPKGWWL